MINVYIYKDDNIAYGFKIEGHSSYAEHGRDIVCSAVSILTQTILITLQNIYGHKCMYVMSSGFTDVKIIDVEDLREVQILFKALELGITGIQEQYPGYVKLN